MSGKIDLVVDNGKVLVWNVDDCIKIRQECRIVGQLFGCAVNLSYQEKHRSLPLALMKEEVNILVEKGYARLVQVPALSQEPTQDAVERYNEYREQNYHKQVANYKEAREKQLRSMIDRIVEGKKNKRKQRLLSSITPAKISKQATKEKLSDKTSDNEEDIQVLKPEKPDDEGSSLDPAVLLKEEIEKIEPFPPENALVTSFVVSPFVDAVPMAEPVWDYPSNEKEYLHYRVFRDLWEKGYYITHGHNFGGDYLVYPGDPLMFHAHYIVHCVDHNDPISATDLIAYGRLSVSVRKRAVLASLKPIEDESKYSVQVVYQTVSWSSKYVHPASKLPPFIRNRQLDKTDDIPSDNSG